MSFLYSVYFSLIIFPVSPRKIYLIVKAIRTVLSYRNVYMHDRLKGVLGNNTVYDFYKPAQLHGPLSNNICRH